jgi:hypothetical protein
MHFWQEKNFPFVLPLMRQSNCCKEGREGNKKEKEIGIVKYTQYVAIASKPHAEMEFSFSTFSVLTPKISPSPPYFLAL